MTIPGPSGALAVLAVALLAGASGCADPYSESPKTADSTVRSTSRSPHERPEHSAVERPARGWSTPQAALRDYANASMNWTWKTLARQQTTLAARSTGQAREHATLLSTTAAHDSEMRRGKIVSRGTVQVLQARAQSSKGWLVVTHEASGSDSTPTFERPRPRYHVIVAAVAPLADGRWVVSEWRPQV